MSWFVLLPLYLGFVAVLQGGLNRLIGRQWGLAGAVFMNNLVFLAAGLTLFIMARASSHLLPEIFHDKGSFRNIQWWYAVPGLLGFSLVAGIPLAISRLGALKVFVGLVAAQMVASLLWDAMVEQVPLNAYRIAGAVMAAGGALIATLGSAR